MNPRMITLARESRGLSQSELATKARIPQGTLSKAENGFIDLPEERVQAIADALGYPRALLDWSDPVYGFGSSMFHHRKQQSLTQGLLKKIQATMNLVVGRLRRLSNGIEITTPFTLPAMDSSKMSPEEIAQAVRRAWLVPIGPVQSMMALLEAAGILIVRRDMGTHRISAISIRIPDGHTLIMLNLGLPPDRERFTLAHELGHLVMHDLPEPEEDAENEADRFAAEFLMPAAEIRSQLTRIDIQKAAMLKRHWKTAMSALIRRARDLGVIAEPRYRSLMTQMSQRGILKIEPTVDLAREEPRVVASVLDVHISQHQYSRQDLADLVCLNRDEFIAEFAPPHDSPLAARREGRTRLQVVR